MKYLSPESRVWLEKDDNLKFADYFVALATDARDRKWRKAAIGLDSEIIMHGPPEANAWTEYADQYRLVLLNL